MRNLVDVDAPRAECDPGMIMANDAVVDPDGNQKEEETPSVEVVAVHNNNLRQLATYTGWGVAGVAVGSGAIAVGAATPSAVAVGTSASIVIALVASGVENLSRRRRSLRASGPLERGQRNGILAWLFLFSTEVRGRAFKERHADGRLFERRELNRWDSTLTGYILAAREFGDETLQAGLESLRQVISTIGDFELSADETRIIREELLRLTAAVADAAAIREPKRLELVTGRSKRKRNRFRFTFGGKESELSIENV